MKPSGVSPRKVQVGNTSKTKEHGKQKHLEDSVTKASTDDSTTEDDTTSEAGHYATAELKRILNYNEGIDRMNQLAALLHQEYIDDVAHHPGAASTFYEQSVNIENSSKYPKYLSHTPDSMFETTHIKFESPILNTHAAAGVCRDPTPEEFANYLKKTGSTQRSEQSITKKGKRSTTSTPVSKSFQPQKSGSVAQSKSRPGSYLSGITGDPSEDDAIQSVIHPPEVWKLNPEESYAGSSQNTRNSLGGGGMEKDNLRFLNTTQLQPKNVFVNSTKPKAFWVHLGIPMPTPPAPFITSTFMKLNNPNSHLISGATSKNGIRRFTVAMNGFSSDEITFRIESRNVQVTGSKLKDKRSPRRQTRTVSEGFTLPDDLNLHNFQVYRDDSGNVIFEEIWNEPVKNEKKEFGVLDEDDMN